MITITIDGTWTGDGEAVAFIGIDEGREVFAGLAFDAGFYHREVGDAVAAFQFSAFFTDEVGALAEKERAAEESSFWNNNSAASGKQETETDIPTVDMRKKIPLRSYKVNGYRVQVFAGGNSRNDRVKAQKAGSDVKMAYPDIPVYVHFYSPRWICRMGNFRTYEEASAILKGVKKLGYKQACIVSGKITVAY